MKHDKLVFTKKKCITTSHSGKPRGTEPHKKICMAILTANKPFNLNPPQQMAKQSKVVFKTKPQKTPTQYREMTKLERDNYVQERVNKLHELNDKRVFALQEDQDLKLTSLGYFDIPYHCDLYSVCL